MTGLIRLIQGLCTVDNRWIIEIFGIELLNRVVRFHHLMVLLLIGVHRVNGEEWVDLFIQVGFSSEIIN